MAKTSDPTTALFDSSTNDSSGRRNQLRQLARSTADLLAKLAADSEAAFASSERLRMEALSRLQKTLSTLPPEEMGALLTALPAEIRRSAGKGKSAASPTVSPTAFRLGDMTAFGVKLGFGNTDVSVGVIVGLDGIQGGGAKIVHRC